MRQMRCVMSGSVLAPEYSRPLVPGEVYDLDERLPQGGRLADVVRLAWFAPLAPPPPLASAVAAVPSRPAAHPAPAASTKVQKRSATPLAPAAPKE